MRPKGRGELDSLYFNYPHFDPPQKREHLSKPVKVAIIGAGPVGMTAALTLAQFGVPVTLFDNKPTFNDGSRAICVARSSFNLFQSLEAEQLFVEKALPHISGRSFFRGKQILEFFMADSPHEKYRPMYNIEQQYIEQYLYNAIEKSELIETRWQSELTAIDDAADSVSLTINDPLDSYNLDAEWVLAADGARSDIRKLRGLRLKGQNYEGRYVIADIQMEYSHKVERFALFDPNTRPGSTVLVHQQPDNIWRIDYQLREGEDETEALTEESIRTGVRQVLEEIGFDASWDLEWWSIYSANTLLLDDYRDGRIFFIGDSAHIVPIFGVRGLNNGIIDGHNIGWKLAYVLNGQADEKLLESYTPERRGATLDVFENATKSARFMTPHSRGYEVMRDAALSLALDHPFAGEFANPRNMTPYTYSGSPITRKDSSMWEAGPVPGAAAPNVKLDNRFLLDQFGKEFTVLAFGPADKLELRDKVKVGVEVITLSADSEAGHVYGAQPGVIYLIRPDLHIAARWKTANVRNVADQINSILQGGSVE